MKIAVFSDIHGNYQVAKAILDDINKNNYDKVICLGDIIGIGPRPKETLELILNSNIDIVLGNHDLYYIKGIEIDDDITDREEIAHHKWIHDSLDGINFNYPLTKEIDINGKRLVFQHYMLSKDTSIDPYPFETISIKNMKDIEDYCESMDYDYMFIGHEHKHFIVEKNNKMIYCVGSSGCVKDNKTFYTVIDIDKDINISRVELEYDREGFINDLKSFKYPDQDMICKYFFGIEKI